jgi:16S rRNA processing protein RimM
VPAFYKFKKQNHCSNFVAMQKEEYFGVGKLVGTFGINGQIVLLHSLGKKTNLKGLEVIMIEVRKGELVPYFVQETKAKNDTEVYLTLEDISTKEKAQRLVSRPVWFKVTDFNKFVDQSSSISMLGYMIYDNEKELSEIVEIIEQPHQILAKIMYDAKEMLIPIHETFIINIDHKNRKVVLNLPDGLLDIF